MDRTNQTPGRLGERTVRWRLAAGSRLRPLLVRRQVQYVLDGLLGAAAMLLAYLFRFDAAVPPSFRAQMWGWSLTAAVLQPAVVVLWHGHRSTWKHFGTRDLVRLLLRQCVLLAVFSAAGLLHQPHAIPIGVALIQAPLAVCLLSGVRLMRRLDYEAMLRVRAGDRVLLAGTVAAVSGALRQLQPVCGGRIAGVVVAEPGWNKLRINGVPVHGTLDQLAMVLTRHRVSLLMLCSAELPQMAEVIQIATDLGVTVKLLPSVHDVLGNVLRVSRTVAPTQIQKDKTVIAGLHDDVLECMHGRTVLVTGAAGSIGSELVRQVKTTRAARLLLLDHDENGIFELLHELGPDVRIVPLVADIRNDEAVRTIFDRERPQVVLHAAAYKHVPLMEQNPCEAVLNNVIGTRILAEASVEFEAERFVMISSDKAVNPSSIMGASKRLAEVVILDIADRVASTSHTRFACVRFGNVLGSRGSVLPLFLKQIEAGGPLTVTHEQMTRYFMTIPQAVGLVLRAATLASTGDIYMLDMGSPVLIVQFARELIQLAGLQPGKDIEIRIVGSRPGEKLHEELWSQSAEVSQTRFEHIFRVRQEAVQANFTSMLVQLEHQARERDAAAVRTTFQQLSINYRSEQAPVLPALAAA